MNEYNKSWATHFMSIVYLVASKSKDPSGHVGAIITNSDNSIISTGYNGLPRGCDDDKNIFYRHRRPTKYSWYEHAERNAIYNAARTGIPLKDSILYTLGLPCVDCARAVIQSGITSIITHKEWHEATLPLITKDQSWATVREEVVREMLEEAEVSVWEYSLNVPSSVGFFNGKTITFPFKEEEEIPF